MTRICFQAIAFASAPAPRSWAPLWGRSLLQVTVRGGEGPAGTPTRDFLLAPGFRDPERSARGSAGQCGAETGGNAAGMRVGQGSPGTASSSGAAEFTCAAAPRPARPIRARRTALCPLPPPAGCEHRVSTGAGD